MAEDYDYGKKFRGWINPAEEPLWAKLREIGDTLDILEKQQLSDIQKEILRRCRERVENARDSIAAAWTGFPWLPMLKKNYRVFWSLVHRVDEDIVLLVPEDELLSRAVDVKTFFDLNIKEEKTRAEWLGRDGQKGKLVESVEALRQEAKNEHRHVIKDAQRIINDQMDNTFWILSLNTMVSVLSGILLTLAMFVFWRECYTTKLGDMANSRIGDMILPIAFLGLMGAYVSNLVTKEDFLFIKGQFWSYLLHHIFSKPILSAFAAVFMILLEKSKLIFSISPLKEGGTTMQSLITLNIGPDVAGYVYAVLAVASGFAADKVLRGMIDKVLKRLEQKAEKTKETINVAG